MSLRNGNKLAEILRAGFVALDGGDARLAAECCPAAMGIDRDNIDAHFLVGLVGQSSVMSKALRIQKVLWVRRNLTTLLRCIMWGLFGRAPLAFAWGMSGAADCATTKRLPRYFCHHLC